MRKLLLIVAVLALALGAFGGIAAQDEPGTIADIVVGSTEAETPEFTILLAALGAADPAFLEIVSDEEAGVTVFAPTDAAFADLLAALEMSAEDVLGNTELLNSVLAYHVVPDVLVAEDVVALDGAYLGTFLHHEALFVSAGDDGVFVNDSQVVTTDIEASNGVVHVIDAVLVPETDDEMMEEDMEDGEMMEEMGSIADVVIASTEGDAPEFTVLLAAVTNADPAVLDLLSEGGPFTVFAPTDAAFAAALEALGITAEDLLADTELLTEVLSYHVVPGYFSLEDITAIVEGSMEMEMEGTFFATALGGTTIEIGDGTVNDAGIAMTDIFADNGVIHVIDGVLLPPAEDDM